MGRPWIPETWEHTNRHRPFCGRVGRARVANPGLAWRPGASPVEPAGWCRRPLPRPQDRPGTYRHRLPQSVHDTDMSAPHSNEARWAEMSGDPWWRGPRKHGGSQTPGDRFAFRSIETGHANRLRAPVSKLEYDVRLRGSSGAFR